MVSFETPVFQGSKTIRENYPTSTSTNFEALFRDILNHLKNLIIESIISGIAYSIASNTLPTVWNCLFRPEQ